MVEDRLKNPGRPQPVTGGVLILPARNGDGCRSRFPHNPSAPAGLPSPFSLMICCDSITPAPSKNVNFFVLPTRLHRLRSLAIIHRVMIRVCSSIRRPPLRQPFGCNSALLWPFSRPAIVESIPLPHAVLSGSILHTPKAF
jgi:hypothetical protein